MTFEQAFAALQAPATAVTLCGVAVLMAAILRGKTRTALTLSGLLMLLHVVWAIELLPDTPLLFGVSVATAFYVALLGLFFAVAVHERAWVAIYIALMPIINWSFAAVPNFPIAEWLGGGNFQPLALMTGLVLVVRDFVQRDIRHWVWPAMIAGLALSMLTSWIVVVFASAAAFLISETVDWAVYTFSNRPLSQRILISSAISAPIDQVVFLYLASQIPSQAGIFALGTIASGIASKLLGAWFVSQVVAAGERRAAKSEMNPA